MHVFYSNYICTKNTGQKECLKLEGKNVKIGIPKRIKISKVKVNSTHKSSKMEKKITIYDKLSQFQRLNLYTQFVTFTKIKYNLREENTIEKRGEGKKF